MDMKAIYDELEHADIVFDLIDEGQNGPFFDLEGRIHMPKSCCTEEFRQLNRPAHLYTLLMNVSVQGETRNDGLQWLVNFEALNKLNRIQMWPAQRNQLDKVEMMLKNYRIQTNFNTAHEVMALLQPLGYLSTDCYGGKDRTGYAIALEVYHAIHDATSTQVSQDAQAQKKYQSYMDKLVGSYGEQGVAKKVVEDNTGFNVMKLSTFNLSLYLSEKGSNRLAGLGTRLSDFLEAGMTFIQEPHYSPTILYDEMEPKRAA